MKYFKNINSVESLKQQYKTLCKKYHPDLNRDRDTNDIMKEINAEYSDLFNRYKNVHETSDGETYRDSKGTQEKSDDFINVINSIINFDIDIEIIGSWVWCFNSYEYKEQLKNLGFKYAAKKKAWCWHSEDYKPKRSKKTLEEIRDKYGSEKIKEKKEHKKITSKKAV